MSDGWRIALFLLTVGGAVISLAGRTAVIMRLQRRHTDLFDWMERPDVTDQFGLRTGRAGFRRHLPPSAGHLTRFIFLGEWRRVDDPALRRWAVVAILGDVGVLVFAVCLVAELASRR